MKLVIGVCGIGYGHSSRQLVLADALRERGHNIRIVAYGTAVDLFRRSGYEVHEVMPPFLRGNGDRLVLTNLIRDNTSRLWPGLIVNGRTAKHLWNFHPNAFLTDYEPVTAWIAYCFQKPLVTVDQQSKFRFFSFPQIGLFSLREERQRQTLFFPRAAMRFIASFYKLPVKPGTASVQLVPPIIAPDVYRVAVRHEPLILIYLSQYFGQTIDQPLTELQTLFSRFSSYIFHIYASRDQHLSTSPRNVKFFELDRTSFIVDLGRCAGVLSTAGHTLISEALTLGKPLLLLPLPTFDQHYCAHFIESHSFGMSAERLDQATLTHFIEQLPVFANNIKTSTHLTLGRDAVETIVNCLEEQSWTRGI